MNMHHSILNKFSTACLHMALSASSLSAMGAAQSYYKTRRGGYAGSKQYMADPGLAPTFTRHYKSKKEAGSKMQNETSEFNFTVGRKVRELLIVDGAVQNKTVFYKQQKPGVEVVEIPNNGGLTALMEVLSRYHGLDAIHLVSHARPGELYIGGQKVNSESLQANVSSLAILNGAIREGGDLMLYGCELAKGQEGDDFLQIIKGNTHVDVAASVDRTGNAGYGGNWDLEIQKGDINAKVLPESIAMKDFTGVLQTFSMNSADVVTQGAFSPASSNAQVHENGGTAYTMIIDGYADGTYIPTGSGYCYIGGSATESKVTLTFTNSETFDPSALYLYLSVAATATITSDVSGSANYYIAANSSHTFDLSGLASNTSALTITFSTNVSGHLDDVVMTSITAPNSAPTLTSSVSLTTINEDDSNPTGDDIASLITSFGANYTDADGGDPKGLAIVGVDETNGSWQYSTNGGTSWSSLTGVADATARLLASSASNMVRFVPGANYNGNSGNITFRAWDQTSGSDGGTADASSNGGSTAFSSGTGTGSLTITAVNDPPTASSVTFTGTLTQGQLLSGSYTYSDPESDTESGTTYKWYRADDSGGTNEAAISGATAQTYTLVVADVGKYISFEVTPSDGSATGSSVQSTRQGAVSAPADVTPPVVNSISVSGSPAANATSVDFVVDFDENANNVSTGDFTVTTASGTATGTVSSVSAASGDPITVTVNSISGTGSIRLDLNSNTNIIDDSGNGFGTNGYVAAYSSGSTHSVDTDAPTITSIVSIDANADGDVDGLEITFSEAITDADFTANSSAALADWSVSSDGFSSSDVVTSFSTNHSLASVANDKYVTLSFTPVNVSGTGVVDYVYTNNGGDDITDANGNVLADITQTSANDGALPKLLSATAVSDTQIQLQYSEDVTPTWSTSSDWAASSMTSTGASQNVDNSIVNLAVSSLGNTGFVASDFSLTINDDTNDQIVDGNGNKAANVTGFSITDSQLPVMLSAATSDHNADGTLDSLVITFSEPVTITDNGTDDYFGLVGSISGYNASIKASTYGATTSTMYLLITPDSVHNTAQTITPTYNSSATGDIKDASGNEMANNATVTGTDGAGPAIISTDLAIDNTYIEVTFSEGIYDNLGSSAVGNAINDQFSFSFTQNGGVATSASVSSIETSGGGSNPVAGDRTIRFNLSITGTADGNEYINITVNDGSSVADNIPNLMVAGETTGDVNLFNESGYIAKSGVNSSISSIQNSDPGTAATAIVFQFSITNPYSGGGDRSIKFTGMTFRTAGSNTVTDWSDLIAGARLEYGSDATKKSTSATINTNSIVFTGIDNGNGRWGDIDELATKSYNLKIWLNSSISNPDVIDSKDIQFSLAGNDISYTSSYTLNSSSSTNSDLVDVDVVATKLGFDSSDDPSGGTFERQGSITATVVATDANGFYDLSNTSVIDVAQSAGTGTLTGTVQKTMSSGSVTFSDLNIDDVSSTSGDKTLSFTDNGSVLTSTSANLTIDDTIGPSITSTTPVDNTTGIAVNSSLVANFDENIALGTGNFYLVKASVPPVYTTIDITDNSQVSVAGSTMTVTPSGNMESLTDYYILMQSGTLTDTQAGLNAFTGLSDNSYWNFTTADVVLLNSVTAASSTQLVLNFNTTVALNGAPDNATDFTVTDALGNDFSPAASGDIADASTDSKIELTVPDLSTAVGDLTITYTSTTSVIEDNATGTKILADFTGFAIDYDQTDPTISSATQDNNTQITVTFNEPVQSNGTNPSDFTVADGYGNNYTVSAQASAGAGSTNVTLTVADMSAAIGDITVTYTNSNGEIYDYGSNEAVTQSTVIDLDNTAPTLASFIKSTNTLLIVTFSEDVQLVDGTPATNFTVTDGLGNTYTVGSIDDAVAKDTELELTVSTLASAVGDINLKYTMSGTDIQDFGSNSLQTNATGIVLDNDNTAPTLQSATDNNGSTSITLTFDEQVKIVTDVPGDFLVMDGVGTTYTVNTVSDGTAKDNQLDLGVNDYSSAIGDLTITYTSSTSDYQDFGGNSLANDATGVTINFDSVDPALQSATVNGTTQIDVTFDDAVQDNGATASDFKVVDGIGNAFSVSAIADATLKDSQLELTVADFSAAIGDLTLSYTHSGGSIDDFGGNSLADDATGVTVEFDGTKPVMSSASKVNNTTIDVTFDDRMKVVNAAPSGDYKVTDGYGNTYEVGQVSDNVAKDAILRLTVQTMANAIGDITVTYASTGSDFQDFGGNSLADDATGVVIDNDAVAPTVTITKNAVTNGTLPNTNDNQVSFNIGFSEIIDPATFDITDVTLNAVGVTYTTPTNAELTTSDNKTYTLTINNVAGDGTLNMTLVAASVTDYGSNNLGTINTTTAFQIDNTAPTANPISISSNRGVGTGALIGDKITLTFTMLESVSSTPVVTFQSGGGVINNSVSYSNSGLAYDAAYIVSDLDNSGDVTFNVSFTDLAGNTNNTTSVTDISSVKVDSEAPTVSSVTLTPLTSGSTSSTNQNTITYTIVFSEAVDPANFTYADDIVPNASGVTLSNPSLTTSDNITWTLSLDVSGDGTFDFSIKNDGTSPITDVVGNTIPDASSAPVNIVAKSAETITFDNTAPAVSSITANTPTSGSVANTNADNVSFGIKYDQAIDNSTFTLDDIQLDITGTVLIGGAAANGLQGSDGTLSGNVTLNATGDNINYTLAISNITGDGNIGITLIGSGIQDAADNYLGGGSGVNSSSPTDFTIDNTLPTASNVTIYSDNTTNTDHAITGNTVSLSFTVDDNLSGTPTINFFKSGLALVNNTGSVSGTNPNYVASYLVDATDEDGTVTFSISFTDDAGNTVSSPVTAVSGTGSSSSVTVDNTAPTVTITRNAVTNGSFTSTNDASVSYDLAFNESIVATDFTYLDDINSSTSGLTVTPVLAADGGTSLTDFTLTYGSITGDGTLSFTLKNNGSTPITDLAGNALTASVVGDDIVIDNTAPTVTITRNSVSSGSFTGTNDNSVSFDIAFSTAIDNSTFTAGDIAINTTNTVSYTGVSLNPDGDNQNYTFVISGVANDGDLSINIAAASITDAATNGLAAAATSSTITVDNTPPTATAVSIVSDNGTNTDRAIVGDKITLSFTLDDDLYSGTLPSVTFKSGGALINDTEVVTSLGAYQYTATYVVSSLDKDGDVTFSIDFTDDAGNAVSTAVTSVTDATSVTVDNVAPTVTITRNAVTNGSFTNTNDASVSYDIAFDEAIDNNSGEFSLADINATIGGTLSVTPTLVADGGTSLTDFTLTYAISSGDGSINFTLINNDGTPVTDLAGNVLAASVDSETFTIDNTSPGITTLSPNNPSTGTVANTNSDNVSYDLAFNQVIDNSTFTLADIQLDITGSVLVNNVAADGLLGDDGSLGGSVTLTADGDNQNYTILITNVSGDGTIGITLIGSGIQDAADNYLGGGTGVNQSTATDFTIDNTPPSLTTVTLLSDNTTNNQRATDSNTISLTLVSNDNLNGLPTVTFFSDGVPIQNSVTVVDDSAPNLTNFTASYVVDGTGTVGIDRDADGTVTFSVSFTDDAGNAGTTVSSTTNSSSVIVDTNIPYVTFTKPTLTDPTNHDPFDITATFDEAITGLTTSDFTIANGVITAVSGTSTVHTVTINPTDGYDGNVVINLNANAVIDDAGNANAVSSDFDIPFDDVPPVLTVSTSTAGRTLSTNAQLDEPGKIYYAVVNSGVSVTSNDLRDGTNNVASAVQHGSIDVTTTAVNAFDLTLDADRTSYDYYLTTEDKVDTFNLDLTPTLIGVTSGGVAITAPDLTDICLDGNYKALGDIVITEKIITDFKSSTSNRTLVLELPEYFEFNSSAGSVSDNGGDVTTSGTGLGLTYNSSKTAVTLTYSVATMSNLDVVTISGLEIMANSKGDGNIQDDNITGNIVRSGGSGEIYLANESDNKVFATLSTTPPYNAPDIVTSAPSSPSQPYIIENDSVILGDFLGDGVVVYDYDKFNASDIPFTVGALVAGNTINVYSDETLSTLIFTESTSASRDLSLTDLQMTSAVEGLHKFWITVTNAKTCESAATKIVVAVIRHQNTANKTSFSISDNVGSIFRFSYPSSSYKVTFETNNGGLKDRNSNSPFSSPTSPGYSYRYDPSGVDPGRDTLKFSLILSGDTSNYWVPLLVNSASNVFADRNIPTAGICADEGTVPFDIYQSDFVDFIGTDGSDPDFYTVRLFDYDGDQKGSLLNSTLLTSAPDTTSLSTPTDTTGWELDASAALSLMGDAYSRKFLIAMYIADENTQEVTELVSESFTIYKNPYVKIVNVDTVYCEDDDDVLVKYSMTYSGTTDETDSAKNFTLWKYNETTMVYDSIREASDAVFKPQDPNGNGDITEDETGKYKIEYTSPQRTNASCSSDTTFFLTLLSKPSVPVLQDTLFTSRGQSTDTDYLLEFCSGSRMPDMVVYLDPGNTDIKVNWYSDPDGLSPISQNTSGTYNETLDVAAQFFGDEKYPTAIGQRQDRTFYFSVTDHVSKGGGCESVFRKVTLSIYPDPDIPQMVLPTNTGLTNDIHSALTQEVYYYEYCTPASTPVATTDFDDIIIKNTMDTKQPTETYFRIYDESNNPIDSLISGELNITAINLETWFGFNRNPGDSVGFYVSLTNYDNNFPTSASGYEFVGCESSWRTISIEINEKPTSLAETDFKNNAYPEDLRTDFYICSGDDFGQISTPGENGIIYRWYTDDGTGNPSSNQINIASVNDQYVIQSELITAGFSNIATIETTYSYWVTQITNTDLNTGFPGCESDPTKITITVFPDPETPLVDGKTSLEYSYCTTDLSDTNTEMVLTGAPNSVFYFYVADANKNPVGSAQAFNNGAIDADGTINISSSDLRFSTINQNDTLYYLISQQNNINPNNSKFVGCETETASMAFLTINIYDIPDVPQAIINGDTIQGPAKTNDPYTEIVLSESEVVAYGIDISTEGNSNQSVVWYDADSYDAGNRDTLYIGTSALATDLGLDGTTGNTVKSFKITQTQDISSGETSFVGCPSEPLKITIVKVPTAPTASDPSPICSDIVTADNVGIIYHGLKPALGSSQFNWYENVDDQTSYTNPTTPGDPEADNTYTRDWFSYINQKNLNGKKVVDVIYVSQQFTVSADNSIQLESERTPVEVVFYARPVLKKLDKVNGDSVAIKVIEACYDASVTVEVQLENLPVDSALFNWYGAASRNNSLLLDKGSMQKKDDYTVWFTFYPSDYEGKDNSFKRSNENNYLRVDVKNIHNVGIQSNDVCESSDEFNGLELPATPVPQLRWEGLTKGLPVDLIFRDNQDINSETSNSNIDSVALTIHGLDTTLIMNTNDLGANFALGQEYSFPYEFPEAGTYKLELYFHAILGCDASIIRYITILDHQAVTGEQTFSFGDDNGSSDNMGWVVDSTDVSGYGTLENSKLAWQLGKETSITYGASDPKGSYHWATSLGSLTYPEDVDVWVYSPSFDISALELPSVSFSSAYDIEINDGVVLEYSIDDGRTWAVVGDFNKTSQKSTGKNWYNLADLPSTPGPGTNPDPTKPSSNPNNVGWTLHSFDGWATSANKLNDNYEHVRFRFALGATAGVKQKAGFAFDDFTLFSRGKRILLEQFSSLSNNPKNKSELVNEAINMMYTNQASPNYIGNDAIWINYYTQLLSANDVLTARNVVDPGARASYYGISQPGSSVFTGDLANGEFGPTEGQDTLSWDINDFNAIALDGPGVDVTKLEYTVQDGQLIITSQWKSNIDLVAGTELSFRFAIIEREYTNPKVNGGKPLYNVLRKMLPSAAGLTYIGKLEKNQPILVNNDPTITVKWNISNVDVDQLSIVAFAQLDALGKGESSAIPAKYVLQAAKVDIPSGTIVLPQVLGIENRLQDIHDYTIYPNPADKFFKVQFENAAKSEMNWVIFDQAGRKLKYGIVKPNELEIEIESDELPSGIYIIQFYNEENHLVPKRFMIRR